MCQELPASRMHGLPPHRCVISSGGTLEGEPEYNDADKKHTVEDLKKSVACHTIVVEAVRSVRPPLNTATLHAVVLWLDRTSSGNSY
jgi:hypothetical protein